MYLEICTLLVISMLSWALLVNVNWLFLFVVQIPNFWHWTGLHWMWGKAVILIDCYKFWCLLQTCVIIVKFYNCP